MEGSRPQPTADPEADPVARLFSAASLLLVGSSRLVGGMATPAAFSRIAANLARYRQGKLTVLDVESPPTRPPRAELGVVLLPPEPTLLWARRLVLEQGCRALVLLNGGCSTRQRIRLRELAARHAVTLLGPNSILGLMDTTTGLDTSFELEFMPAVGDIALVCQSGGVGAMLLDLARDRSIGLSKVIFPGDKVGLSDADLMAYLATDPATRAVAIYVEGLAEGGRFRQVVARMTRDKPLVALKGGASEAAAARAKSHTASLAGNSRLFASALRTAGGLMVESPEALLLVAEGLSRLPRPGGDQLALISNVGGPAILLADALSAAGYHLPRLAGPTWTRIKRDLPMVETINPVDLIADADGPRYAACLQAALADPHVHVVVLVVQFRSTYLQLKDLELLATSPAGHIAVRPADTSTTRGGAASREAKPIVVVCPGSPLRDQVAARLPWPVYGSPGEAVTVLSKLREWGQRRVQAVLESG